MPGKKDEESRMGLVLNHAYSVACVRRNKVRDKDVSMVRLRNPWGRSGEWTGAWSDG